MVVALAPNARVLLVRLSAMGDVLFGLETLASMKRERPDLRVDWLVEDRFAGLLRGHPQLEQVLEVPRRDLLRLPGALARLRRTRYDVALDLHGILKSALQTRAARAGRKIGFADPPARECAHWLYRERVPVETPLPHRAEWGLALLRQVGLSGAPARPVVLQPPRPCPFWPPQERLRIVLNPATSEFARFKRWPLPAWIELARRWAGRGASIAVSFGPGEGAFADAIGAQVPGILRADAAQLGFPNLASVFAQCSVAISADTGPLHLAAAAGAPVVAIFGPKDTRLYGPRGPATRVVFHAVPCRPCKRRDCVTPLCVLGVEVDAVEAAMQDLVG
jgi:ADP-heptose:LPS heptosyltransferase